MAPLPTQFAQRMEQELGSHFQDFSEALLAPSPTSIRLNPGKTYAYTHGLEPVPWCQGAYYLQERPAFYKDPAIFAGAYYVQEASSMFLDLVMRQHAPLNSPLAVLDLCAAPGGKSTLLSSLIPPDGLLVSNELVGKRVPPLMENLVRWGNPHVVVTQNNPLDFAPIEAVFDVIVIDAPCSGEGMFRKDPKAVQQWNPGLVEACAARQKQILQAVMHTLKPGGLLVYSTCTFSRAENEDNITWLANQGDFEPLTVTTQWGITPSEIPANGQCFMGYRFYPHLAKGEGFFLCALRKAEGHSNHLRLPKKAAKLPLIPFKHHPHFAHWLHDASMFEFIGLEDTVHFFPKASLPLLNYLHHHLHVRQMGIEGGKFKQQKFIPAHPLAVSNAIDRKLPSFALSYEQAIAFLQKKDFALDDQGLRNWVLATYEGNVLGLMKMLGNRINNHYPAELRIRKEF